MTIEKTKEQWIAQWVGAASAVLASWKQASLDGSWPSFRFDLEYAERVWFSMPPAYWPEAREAHSSSVLALR